MKTFSLDEVQTLLPIVEALLTRAIAAAEEALRLEERFAELRVSIFHSGGMRLEPVALARSRAELEKCRAEAAEAFGELDALGVLPRSPGAGMVDFPAQLQGERVMLCWRRGEGAVRHWHAEDESCAARQPMEMRATKAAAKRLKAQVPGEG